MIFLLGAQIIEGSGFILGGVPERSKGADCKSAGSAFEGSNPSPSTKGAVVLGLRRASRGRVFKRSSGCVEVGVTVGLACFAGVAQW